MVVEKAFKIKIEPELGQAKSFLSGLGLGGVAKGGVAAGAGLAVGGGLVQLISSLKVFDQVKKIMQQVLNVLGEFLRPIADVLVILLKPILQILRPILQVVRQIMQPFRQAAFALQRQAGEKLREGDKAGFIGLNLLALGEIGVGVNAVFAFFAKESLKALISGVTEIVVGLTGALAELFRPIIEFFGGNVDEMKEKMADSIRGFGQAGQDAIDFAFGSLIAVQAAAIAKAAQALGGDISTEFTKQIDVLKDFFVTGDNSFAGTFNQFTGFLETEVNNNLKTSLDGIVERFQSAANEINNIQIGGSAGSPIFKSQFTAEQRSDPLSIIPSGSISSFLNRRSKTIIIKR